MMGSESWRAGQDGERVVCSGLSQGLDTHAASPGPIPLSRVVHMLGRGGGWVLVEEGGEELMWGEIWGKAISVTEVGLVRTRRNLLF